MSKHQGKEAVLGTTHHTGTVNMCYAHSISACDLQIPWVWTNLTVSGALKTQHCPAPGTSDFWVWQKKSSGGLGDTPKAPTQLLIPGMASDTPTCAKPQGPAS